MPNVRHRDAPDYAANVMDGAQPIGSQLVVAAGLIIALLVAMSAMDAPMQLHDIDAAGVDEKEHPPAQSPDLLCAIRGEVKGWTAAPAS
jgi:hypothetical protein